MTYEELVRAIEKIQRWEVSHGGSTYRGIPNRWLTSTAYRSKGRCPNTHVRPKSADLPGGGFTVYNRCPACGECFVITFPEDKDGPLEHPALV
jgi:hypothetical protein